MQAHNPSPVRIRASIAYSLLGLFALAAFSATADARSCRMMKPPAYMGAFPMPPMHRPMYGHMPQVTGHAAGMPVGADIISVAKRAGDFTILLTAVEAAGLTGLLRGDGPFTLFAPTDAAFKNLPEGALQELLADKAKLSAFLKYHLVPGRITAADILVKRTLPAASGQELPTGELSIIRADIHTRNGVVHVLDEVLLPSG